MGLKQELDLMAEVVKLVNGNQEIFCEPIEFVFCGNGIGKETPR